MFSTTCLTYSGDPVSVCVSRYGTGQTTTNCDVLKTKKNINISISILPLSPHEKRRTELYEFPPT